MREEVKMYDENPTKTLTEEEYNKHKGNDRFLHEICFAHGVEGWEPYNKALCYYVIGTDFKVSPELQDKAKKDYQKRKEEIVKSLGNKLVFVGMGMSFEPSTINHIGNHRIRTYILNKEEVLCFVEFGTGRDKDFLRCDHALMHTKKCTSEWNGLSERERAEKRIAELENIRGDYIEYTKENILNLVNTNFNCSFSEVEVYDYCLGTEDYESRSEV